MPARQVDRKQESAHQYEAEGPRRIQNASGPKRYCPTGWLLKGFARILLLHPLHASDTGQDRDRLWSI